VTEFVSPVLFENSAMLTPDRPIAKYAMAATTARSAKMNTKPEVIFRPIVSDESFTSIEEAGGITQKC
jgi:hypothetical protein